MNYDTATDEEILEHILECFEEDGRLNLNYIDFEVVDGTVTVAGRVSSPEEQQIIGEIMTDTLELEHYKNNVWVDETLSYDDAEETSSPDLKNLTFEDNEIEEGDYSDEDEDEENMF